MTGLDGKEEMLNSISDIKIQIKEQAPNVVVMLATDMVHSIQSSIQENGSIVTGRMFNSITADLSGNDGQDGVYKAVVGPAEDAFRDTGYYPIYVEFGRGPVFPKNKMALHYFAKDGTEVFAKYSGPAAPRPFMLPGLLKTEEHAPAIILSLIHL